MHVQIQKKTGKFFAFAGAYTFKNRQSSLPGLDTNPYAAGVSAPAPVCGQAGGSLSAAMVAVLFLAGVWGAAQRSFPSGGAAYRSLQEAVRSFLLVHDANATNQSIPLENVDIVGGIVGSAVDGVAQINGGRVPRSDDPRNRFGDGDPCEERARNGTGEDFHRADDQIKPLICLIDARKL
jgi:hypothetical protein